MENVLEIIYLLKSYAYIHDVMSGTHLNVGNAEGLRISLYKKKVCGTT